MIERKPEDDIYFTADWLLLNNNRIFSETLYKHFNKIMYIILILKYLYSSNSSHNATISFVFKLKLNDFYTIQN